MKQRPTLLLPPEQIPIEVRIEQLLARLSETEACGFEDLFTDVQTRGGVIVISIGIFSILRSLLGQTRNS